MSACREDRRLFPNQSKSVLEMTIYENVFMTNFHLLWRYCFLGKVNLKGAFPGMLASVLEACQCDRDTIMQIKVKSLVSQSSDDKEITRAPRALLNMYRGLSFKRFKDHDGVYCLMQSTVDGVLASARAGLNTRLFAALAPWQPQPITRKLRMAECFKLLPNMTEKQKLVWARQCLEDSDLPEVIEANTDMLTCQQSIRVAGVMRDVLYQHRGSASVVVSSIFIHTVEADQGLLECRMRPLNDAKWKSQNGDDTSTLWPYEEVQRRSLLALLQTCTLPDTTRLRFQLPHVEMPLGYYRNAFGCPSGAESTVGAVKHHLQEKERKQGFTVWMNRLTQSMCEWPRKVKNKTKKKTKKTNEQDNYDIRQAPYVHEIMRNLQHAHDVWREDLSEVVVGPDGSKTRRRLEPQFQSQMWSISDRVRQNIAHMLGGDSVLPRLRLVAVAASAPVPQQAIQAVAAAAAALPIPLASAEYERKEDDDVTDTDESRRRAQEREKGDRVAGAKRKER
jgi:hypothetical protein